MYARNLLTGLFLFISIFILSGCGGGGSSSSSSSSAVFSSQSGKSVINGKVTTTITTPRTAKKTATGAVATTTAAPAVTTTAIAPVATTTIVPVVGATISAGGKTTTTDETGAFTLKDVAPKKELSLSFTHEEYWPVTRLLALPAGTTSTVNFQVATVKKSGSFNSANGGVYKEGLTSITLPADSYVVSGTNTPYEGTVFVAARYLNVHDFEDSLSFPNSYRIKGKDGDTLLQTFGAQNIILGGENGESLKLAPSTVAIIEMPAIQAPAEDQTMKVWKYNAGSGYWEFASNTAIKNDRFRAVLSQVGLISLGIASPSTGKVMGCVVNPKNEPQQHAKAQAIGNSWLANALDTDANGNFSMDVVSDTPFFVAASKNGAYDDAQGKKHTVAAGATLEIPDCLVLGSPSAKFTLAWDGEPSDLDAHIVFTRPVTPAEGAAEGATDGAAAEPGIFDVFFGAQFIDDVALTSDSVSGGSTEVITINGLTDGEYTFSVHHFNGLGKIANSGAVVKLEITGDLPRVLTAPLEGGTGVDDVWTVWKILVKSGKIMIADVNKIAKKSLKKSTAPQIDISVKGIIQE